jgi:NADH-quinone oxidoreductase subunit E
MIDWTVRTATMSVFGKSDQRERNAMFEYGERAFDLPAEMTAAMQLMTNPAAGIMAMSALGFGIAAQAFGLWAGTMTGALQVSQNLLTASASGRATTERPRPAPAAKRQKPALTVVATNEVPAEADASQESAAGGDSAGRVISAPAEPVRVEDVPESAARKPRSIGRPAAPDDLKAISGIGPKLEKVLNDLGIWTYAQIAAWDKGEVAWVDDHLGFKGRVDRDAWITQARAMTPSRRRN